MRNFWCVHDDLSRMLLNVEGREVDVSSGMSNISLFFAVAMNGGIKNHATI